MFDPVRALFNVVESFPVPPRTIRLLELADQKLFPSILRQRIQSTLSQHWDKAVPYLQPNGTPAEIASQLVAQAISAISTAGSENGGESKLSITVVDFGSGAGGPTPFIERFINQHVQKAARKLPVPFVVTDLNPHIDEWIKHASHSIALSFFPQPVDAGKPPAALLNGKGNGSKMRKRSVNEHVVLRTFHSSFQHLSDVDQVRVFSSMLHNDVPTANGSGNGNGNGNNDNEREGSKGKEEDRGGGFLITTPHTRDLPTLLLLPVVSFFLSWASTLSLFNHDWVHIVFTYPVPILPTIVAFDVFSSCLRNKTSDEILHMAEVILDSEAVELSPSPPLPSHPPPPSSSSISSATISLSTSPEGVSTSSSSDDGEARGRRRLVSTDASSNSDHSSPSTVISKEDEPSAGTTTISRSPKIERRKRVRVGDWIMETGRVLYFWPVGSLEYVMGYKSPVHGDASCV